MVSTQNIPSGGYRKDIGDISGTTWQTLLTDAFCMGPLSKNSTGVQSNTPRRHFVRPEAGAISAPTPVLGWCPSPRQPAGVVHTMGTMAVSANICSAYGDGEDLMAWDKPEMLILVLKRGIREDRQERLGGYS